VENTQDKGSESVVTSRQKRCNSGESESVTKSDIWVKTYQIKIVFMIKIKKPKTYEILSII
jgi:hypothetical protein